MVTNTVFAPEQFGTNFGERVIWVLDDPLDEFNGGVSAILSLLSGKWEYVGMNYCEDLDRIVNTLLTKTAFVDRYGNYRLIF